MTKKSEKPWLWLSITIVMIYMYIGNLYAHLMSSDVDNVVLSIATLVFMFLSYWVGYIVWKKFLLPIFKIKKR